MIYLYIMLDTDTMVALSTSEGYGAIAVIRVSGAKAFSSINNIFRSLKKKNIKDKISLGYIVEKEEKIDQVLLTSFKAPNSYTGEDIIEISCHGSPYIYRRILHIIINTGVRMACPGEFTMRAFLNGKMNLSQAESVLDLITSEYQIDHKLAITQFRGETYKQIEFLRKKFIDFASLLEINIDFSEEGIEIINYSIFFTFVCKTKGYIQDLLKSFQLGNSIKKGLQVVIIGGPNVGKSTFLNTLVKYDRAIVSDIPGTTRDFIEETIYLYGLKFKFIDTAGIRPSKDKIESIGIRLTYDKVKHAQIIIYILDVIKYNKTKILKDIYNFDYLIKNMIIIVNKYDISKKKLLFKEFLGKIYNLSAKNKKGIDEFFDSFSKLFKSKYLQNNRVLSNIRHYEVLKRTLSCLNAITYSLEQGYTEDIIASDIRKVLYYLGKISGEITTNELLRNIFSKFCIGK